MGSDGNMKIIEWKWIALLILVIQNSSLTLMMRYSRIVAPANVSYITSTAVVAAEAIKLFLSCILCIHQDCNMNISEFLRILRREFTEGWKDFLKLFIPSGLYVLQNNLQYIAASNLPADVFQVLSQMKVITTAIFSVTMLPNRKLSFIQWISVIGLAAGLGVVQVSQSVKKSSATAPDANFIGFVCVICSSLTSGFAGVYFEKVLKSTASSIWMRNIQMALIGLGISLIGCISNDLDTIHRDGFFRGYSNIVWTVIMLSAAGGLVVAVVVKYADNVLKGFATSASIVISCIVSSSILGDSELTALFVFGASIVCGAAFSFSFSPPKPVSNVSPWSEKMMMAGGSGSGMGKEDDDDDVSPDDVEDEEIEFIPMKSPLLLSSSLKEKNDM